VLTTLALVLLAQEVHVRIDTDAPVQVTAIASSDNQVTVLPNAVRIDHVESAHLFCFAPCARTISLTEAAFEYRIDSPGVTDAGTFKIADLGPAVRVNIKTGDALRYAQGRALTVFGGITIGLGALTSLIGAAWAQERIPLVGTGAFTLLGGVCALAGGILLMMHHRTELEVGVDRDYVPPAPEPQPPDPAPL
jgi:hypothetical protein